MGVGLIDIAPRTVPASLSSRLTLALSPADDGHFAATSLFENRVGNRATVAGANSS